jgi:hypothetical protein
LLAVTLAVFVVRAGLALLPQYLESVGRHLQLYRSDCGAADGDADYCPEIDLSVASTMALSSTVMGFCAAAGIDTPLLVVVGLGWVCCAVCLTACWSRA